jgi:hypothetical protein
MDYTDRQGASAVADASTTTGFRIDLINQGDVDLWGSEVEAPSQLFSAALDATGLPADEQRLVCIGSAVPTPDWDAYLLDPAAIPTTCAGGAGGAPIATRRPAVTVFDPDFGAPRAWRGSLGVTRRVGRFGVTLDASYALGTNLYGVRDLNLRQDPEFVLDEEGARPVFVPAATIDTATGATSVLASREHAEFAQVLDVRSELESRTAQMTLGVNGVSWRSRCGPCRTRSPARATRPRSPRRAAGVVALAVSDSEWAPARPPAIPTPWSGGGVIWSGAMHSPAR